VLAGAKTSGAAAVAGAAGEASPVAIAGMRNSAGAAAGEAIAAQHSAAPAGRPDRRRLTGSRSSLLEASKATLKARLLPRTLV
jgi:hypothetical protein